MLMSSYRSVEARQCVASWRFVVLPMLGIALLISACSTSAATSGVLKAAISPTPTSTPVPTPPPLTIGAAHPLVWKAHRLPAGIQYSSYNWAGPSLAASDSNTAYLCGISGNSVQIWATHDRAATWQKTSAITGATKPADCNVVVDQLQPRHAILTMLAQVAGVVPFQATVQTYLTEDGGATWAPLAPPSADTPIFTALATQGGVTYTIAETPPASACFTCYRALYRSTDGMKTWARADSGLFAQEAGGGSVDRDIYTLQVGAGGALLATAQVNGYAYQEQLWHSDDGGAHWSQLGGDTMPLALNFLVVPAGQGSRFWRACTADQFLGDNSHPPMQRLTCTVDGGQSWHVTGGDNSYFDDIFAQASDGAVLAVTPSPAHGEDATTVVRVTPGKSTWQSLGPLPVGGTPQYVAGGAGVLWLLRLPANYGDSLATVYTATYP